jgi:hypothetical protein
VQVTARAETQVQAFLAKRGSGPVAALERLGSRSRFSASAYQAGSTGVATNHTPATNAAEVFAVLG